MGESRISGNYMDINLRGATHRVRWIPPGRFWMGSPQGEAGRFEDEGPRHEVELTQGLWLGETPVTQALWKAVMRGNPSYFQSPDRPVEQVSWYEAITLCNRLSALLGLEPAYYRDSKYRQVFEGKTKKVYWRREAEGFRLPTEAEWERA